MLDQVLGLRVIESNLLPKFRVVPARVCKRKTRSGYQRRVQKKWNKRFGYRQELIRFQAVLVNDTLIVNRETLEELRRAPSGQQRTNVDAAPVPRTQYMGRPMFPGTPFGSPC